MAASKEHIQDQLAALRKKFNAGLSKRISDMESSLAAWRDQGEVECLDTLYRTAHSLTGAGATFGCQEVSDASRSLEVYAKQLKEDGASAEQAGDNVISLLSALKTTIENISVSDAAVSSAPVVVERGDVPKARCLVYLLEDDEDMRGYLVIQLGYYGYQVQGYATVKEFEYAFAKKAPDVILSDIVLPEGESAGIDCINAIYSKQKVSTPVIFMSSRSDIDARLEAVRARGSAYLHKPFTIEELVDQLDEVSVAVVPGGYRVLVVDDSKAQAKMSEQILVEAGMSVQVLNDPRLTLNVMEEFSPELLLLDMYMPHCDGIELAAVIRQQPAYVSVPIVFLSSEINRNTQLEAMKLGGDDFLTKPIHPSDLVASVATRAERYRKIRSLMSQDSLTGLLNHTMIIDRLASEVSRAQRHDSVLSYVMLDIDYFKQVNDTYGHAVGDSVIKNLSRLLQQRFRTSDVIGRYGGEEFAVILPETPLENAIKVMDGVRKCFAEIEQHADDGSVFFTTFSCGIAGMPYITNAGELRESADARLYIAKNGGRNQVVGEG